MYREMLPFWYIALLNTLNDIFILKELQFFICQHSARD